MDKELVVESFCRLLTMVIAVLVPLRHVEATTIYRHIEPGCIVHCKLAGALDHTGVYIGNNRIIHRDGDGFLAEVSPHEFVKRLDDRFGVRSIGVVCDARGIPLTRAIVAQRAKDALRISKLRNGYHLLCNNCHQFCAYCWTGVKDEMCLATSFSGLKTLISLNAKESEKLINGLKTSKKMYNFMFGGLVGLMTDSVPLHRSPVATYIGSKCATPFMDDIVVLRWVDL